MYGMPKDYKIPRCECGSFAVNEDESRQQCDPCYWCTQADKALQRNAKLEKVVSELFAWANAHPIQVTQVFLNEQVVNGVIHGQQVVKETLKNTL